MKFLRWLLKFLPTFLTAFALAVIVWVSAVNEADPTQEITLTEPVSISVIGLSPDLLMINQIPEQVSVTVRAPQSVLNQLTQETGLIKVTLDLAGLQAGTHSVKLQTDTDLNPIDVTRISPETIEVNLETLTNTTLPIQVTITGTIPVGYQAEDAILNTENVNITGAKSLVSSVSQIIAPIDVSNAIENISRSVILKPVDTNGNLVSGISVSPTSVLVEVPITQLGGYRNVFIKIATNGQIARGFYLTSLSATPPTVTVYASDPSLVNNMPAFVETTPINLNGVNEDFSVEVSLNLPDGISIVGDQTITVQVGIAAIESSINFLNVPVVIENLGNGLSATISPIEVDVYLSGPLYLLEGYKFSDIIIIVDLTDRGPGTYQLVPQLSMLNEEINVDAILPGTIEVVVTSQ